MMLNISASCFSSADTRTGLNRDNLLFVGQFLPERNGGLAGTPTAHVQPPFVTGVFRGYGPEGRGEAAHHAAAALRDAGDALVDGAGLAELFAPLCGETPEEAGAPAGCDGAAVFLTEDRLSLASCGVCRAYLLRDRSLFLLTPSAGPGAALYTVSGTPIAGDRLLLCTGAITETVDPQPLLELIFRGRSEAEALQQLLKLARDNGARDSVTAVLLHFE